MIKLITKADRKRNPKATKGKKYKLVSKKTGKSLSKDQMKKREQVVQYWIGFFQEMMERKVSSSDYQRT